MAVQFLINAKGEKTSVVVPYKKWVALNKEREELIRKLKEVELSMRFKQAFKDAKLFEEGKLETYPIADLLEAAPAHQNTKILEGIKEAVEEVELIRQGKLKGIPAKDLLNEM